MKNVIERQKKFFTTAIDYANDVIHIGHAYEKVLADAFARYERLKRGAENVHFLTGVDEHGTTSQKAAEARGIDPLTHVTDIAAKDKQQIDSLNISYDRFIRTTDEDHEKLSAEFFKKSFENGDIYKAKYVGYYCEGCEAPKTLSELNEEGQCPIHPTKQIQKLDEENYFFKWSKYRDFLKEIISTNQLIVKPEGKRSEMLAFLENGLKDITVSRPKYKVSWGITTPIDQEQVIYVWFDALINYFTEGQKTGFWDADTQIVHFVGKDISRWHALLWPAMLKSAGYRLPDVVYAHGFINLSGQKISKSLGNVIRPMELVSDLGTDAVRYYLLKHGPIVEDADLSLESLREVYNSDLANGLGNTVARISKLADKCELEFADTKISDDIWNDPVFDPLIKNFRVDLTISSLGAKLAEIDKHLNETTPWKIQDKTELRDVLQTDVDRLRILARQYEPFIPASAQKIQKQYAGPLIKSGEILFPRFS